MLKDKVLLYSTRPVVRAPIESKLMDVIRLMARNNIRRVMILDGVKPTFISVDSIIRILASTDPRKVESLDVMYLPLETPPVLHESMTMLEAVLLLTGSGVDYGIVLNDEESILTVRDVIKAVEKRDIEIPVIACISRRYPTIHATARVIDAIKLMARYKVRALLVAGPGDPAYKVYGYLDSRRIIESLANIGDEALMLRVDQVYDMIKARIEPSDAISRAAKILAYTGNTIGVVTVGDYIIGVIDELGILESITCTIAGCKRCEYMLEEKPVELIKDTKTIHQYKAVIPSTIIQYSINMMIY